MRPPDILHSPVSNGENWGGCMLLAAEHWVIMTKCSVAVQKTHTRPNGLLSTLLKRRVCVFACLHLADSSSLSLPLVSPQVLSAPQTGLQSLQSYPPVSCSLSQEPVHPLSLCCSSTCLKKQLAWISEKGADNA